MERAGKKEAVILDRPGYAAIQAQGRRVAKVSRGLAAPVADLIQRSTVLVRETAMLDLRCRAERLRARVLRLDRRAAASLDIPPDSTDVLELCATSDGRCIRYRTPEGPAGCAAARRIVMSTLKDWGFHDAGWLAEAELVITELVSNAVRHGGGCRWVELHVDRCRVILQVGDGSTAWPRLETAQVQATHGRGLALINAMTEGWNAADHDGGKRVWTTLTAHP